VLTELTLRGKNADQYYLRMRRIHAVTAPERHVTKHTQPRATPGVNQQQQQHIPRKILYQLSDKLGLIQYKAASV